MASSEEQQQPLLRGVQAWAERQAHRVFEMQGHHVDPANPGIAAVCRGFGKLLVEVVRNAVSGEWAREESFTVRAS